MEVTGQVNAPYFLFPGKSLPVPIEKEAGWTRESVLDAVAKRKNPCSCRESNHGRPTHSLVTVLAELSRLFMLIVFL
jgi:hypothetical protein